MQRKLDQYSVEQGRLVQTYEIADLDGLEMSIFWNRTVLNFLSGVLLNYSAFPYSRGVPAQLPQLDA